MFSIVVLFILIVMTGALVYYGAYKLGLFDRVGDKALKFQKEFKDESETEENEENQKKKGEM